MDMEEVLLPEPERLKFIFRILSRLDRILSGYSANYTYRFVPSWGGGPDLGLFDSGAGDHMFIIFTERGTVVKGFDRESSLAPQYSENKKIDLYEGLPRHLSQHLEHPMFLKNEVTFCYWQTLKDKEWVCAEQDSDEDNDPTFLLSCIYETPHEYGAWAESCFDISLDYEVLEKVYNGEPLTRDLAYQLVLAADVHADMFKCRIGLGVNGPLHNEEVTDLVARVIEMDRDEVVPLLASSGISLIYQSDFYQGGDNFKRQEVQDKVRELYHGFEALRVPLIVYRISLEKSFGNLDDLEIYRMTGAQLIQLYL